MSNKIIERIRDSYSAAINPDTKDVVFTILPDKNRISIPILRQLSRDIGFTLSYTSNGDFIDSFTISNKDLIKLHNHKISDNAEVISLIKTNKIPPKQIRVEEAPNPELTTTSPTVNNQGKEEIPSDKTKSIINNMRTRTIAYVGLNEKGEHLFDLRNYRIGKDGQPSIAEEIVKITELNAYIMPQSKFNNKTQKTEETPWLKVFAVGDSALEFFRKHNIGPISRDIKPVSEQISIA